MMRTFCVFVLNFLSLLYVRLYIKNVTSLPRFLPFYVSFTVILWNISPLLTLFCVCLFAFFFSFAPNARYFFSKRLHHHIIVEKIYNPSHDFAEDRSTGFIHVESFFKQKNHNPNEEDETMILAVLSFTQHNSYPSVGSKVAYHFSPSLLRVFFSPCLGPERFSISRRADGMAIAIINHQFYFFSIYVYCWLGCLSLLPH